MYQRFQGNLASGMLVDERASTEVFDAEGPGETLEWTCVLTRPRFEKKVARWLDAKDSPFFLPTYDRKTTSHRKTRITEIPLFPSYLFAVGNWNRGDFRESGDVLSVIKPSCDAQVEQLHQELWAIWCALGSGSFLEMTQELEAGQAVEIVDGPLKGAKGNFEKWNNKKRLVLSVDMLGVGVAVEVPDGCVLVPVE